MEPEGKIEDEIHVPEEDGYAQNLVHLCHDGIRHYGLSFFVR